MREPSWPLISIMIVHAGLGAVAYILALSLQRRAGPVYLSQAGYIMTLTMLLSGVILFGERYSAWTWMGCALIVLGVGTASAGAATARQLAFFCRLLRRERA